VLIDESTSPRSGGKLPISAAVVTVDDISC
jgi:hypothetical protein